MKLKYFIFLSIIATGAYYLYQNEDLLNTLIGKVHQVAPELNKSTLYKWQNAKGEWQVTDKPPGKGTTYTTVTSQDQINIISSPATEKKK